MGGFGDFISGDRKGLRTMKKVNIVSALIFDEAREKIVLVKNENSGHPYWSLPGGELEENETLPEAVKRETKEETGLTVSVGDLNTIREVFFNKKGHHGLVFTFNARFLTGEIQINDPDNEILEAKWMNLHEANEVMPYLPEDIQNKEPSSRYYFQRFDDF